MYKTFINDAKKSPKESFLNLKLVRIVDDTEFKKKLDKKKRMNSQMYKSKLERTFKPIEIMREKKLNAFSVNPALVATRSLSSSQEIAELLRMAKIRAFKYRNAFPDDETGYQVNKQQFMQEYGAKISQYNLFTKLNEIFNNYQDKNYRESMFDKDYLGVGISSSYEKSMNERMKNEKKTRDLAMEMRGFELLDPRLGRRLTKEDEKLTLPKLIERYEVDIKKMEEQKQGLLEEMRKLDDRIERIKSGEETTLVNITLLESSLKGLGDKYDELSGNIVNKQLQIEEIRERIENAKRERKEEKARRKEEARIEKELEAIQRTNRKLEDSKMKQEQQLESLIVDRKKIEDMIKLQTEKYEFHTKLLRDLQKDKTKTFTLGGDVGKLNNADAKAYAQKTIKVIEEASSKSELDLEKTNEQISKILKNIKDLDDKILETLDQELAIISRGGGGGGAGAGAAVGTA